MKQMATQYEINGNPVWNKWQPELLTMWSHVGLDKEKKILPAVSDVVSDTTHLSGSINNLREVLYNIRNQFEICTAKSE